MSKGRHRRLGIGATGSLFLRPGSPTAEPGSLWADPLRADPFLTKRLLTD